MHFFSYVFPSVTILLQLTLIVLLAKGPFRRYPVLVLYSVTYIAIIVLEGLALSEAGVDSALYRNLYWTSDLVLDFLLFLMVITLTYRVVAGNPLLRPFARMLFLVAAAAIVLPFILFHPLFQFGWFRHTSQPVEFRCGPHESAVVDGDHRHAGPGSATAFCERRRGRGRHGNCDHIRASAIHFREFPMAAGSFQEPDASREHGDLVLGLPAVGQRAVVPYRGCSGPLLTATFSGY